MATTTNYGWETPDDTDLVKDGAAAIRTLGSSIDTTTKNLNPETTLGDIAYRSATANTNTRLPIGSTGQVLTVAAGVPSWATPASGSTFVGCSLSKSAAQSISNATWTLITWNQENYDTDSFHDNSTNNTRITIPSGKSGKYLIAANLYTPANSAGSRLLKYTKNGTDSYYGNWGPASAVHSTSIVGSQVFNLTAGDYIEVAIYQDTGTSINVNSGIESTFTATYLGA